MQTIILEGVKLYAYHGVAPEENKVGQMYTVNVKMVADLSKAMESDDVNDTINYAEVYESIKDEMGTPSHLIEHAAKRLKYQKTLPTEHLSYKYFTYSFHI